MAGWPTPRRWAGALKARPGPDDYARLVGQPAPAAVHAGGGHDPLIAPGWRRGALPGCLRCSRVAGHPVSGSLPWHQFSVGCALIIPLIIQTIRQDVWSRLDRRGINVSRLDPSGAVQVDAEHPTRNRKAEDCERDLATGTTAVTAITPAGPHRPSASGMVGDRLWGWSPAQGQEPACA